MDPDVPAKLKVQFVLAGLKLGFLSGDYWILESDSNYSHVVVGSPDRKYLWILARTPKLDKAILIDLVERTKEKGFDTSKLLYNPW